MHSFHIILIQKEGWVWDFFNIKIWKVYFLIGNSSVVLLWFKKNNTCYIQVLTKDICYIYNCQNFLHFKNIHIRLFYVYFSKKDNSILINKLIMLCNIYVYVYFLLYAYLWWNFPFKTKFIKFVHKFPKNIWINLNIICEVQFQDTEVNWLTKIDWMWKTHKIWLIEKGPYIWLNEKCP